MSMTTTVLKAEQYSVVNIKWKWDTDGDEELFDSLPEEIVLPLQFASAAEGEDYLDDISEWISDKYGYLHNGFSVRKEHIAYVVFSEMQKQWINELLQMNDIPLRFTQGLYWFITMILIFYASAYVSERRQNGNQLHVTGKKSGWMELIQFIRFLLEQ